MRWLWRRAPPEGQLAFTTSGPGRAYSRPLTITLWSQLGVSALRLRPYHASPFSFPTIIINFYQPNFEAFMAFIS